jgi:hypothetical protein
MRILVVRELEKDGNDLGVSVGLKRVAGLGQRRLERRIVADNAVVHNDERIGRVAGVRVRVASRRLAVRGPTRVRNADLARHALVDQSSKVNGILQRVDVAFHFVNGHIAVRAAARRAVDTHAGRIIATIFKTTKT